MNILPKKSWHVRTKKNIEKVRRDEARAKEEQLEKAKRADLAAQERRINQLRGRLKDSNNAEVPEVEDEKSGHSNFFDEKRDQGKNKARELEKRKEQEEFEKKVGILTYLGGSQVNCETPWYMKQHQDTDQLSSNASFKEALRVEALDPMNDMNKFREINRKLKSKIPEEIDSFKHKKPRLAIECKKTFQRDKKDYHEKVFQNEQTNSKDNHSMENDKEAKLRKLREDRLKRERKEAEKVKKLLLNPAASVRSSIDDERKIEYHQQFNPHLSRRH